MARKPSTVRLAIRAIMRGEIGDDGKVHKAKRPANPKAAFDVQSHKLSRTAWMNTHPRFRDAWNMKRPTNTKGFTPWYGQHNEHKPKTKG